jgi:metal-responsive CopG/Arc/MetJ family transcriptional regulator
MVMNYQDRERVFVSLDRSLLEAIDKIREEWGIRSRADIIERILREVLTPDLTEVQSSNPESNRIMD